MAYSWLFFDADDTLFDYAAGEDYALRTTFTALGLHFSPAMLAAYQRFNQEVWHEMEMGQINQVELRTARFERLFAHLGQPVDSEACSRLYLANLSRAIFLIAGATELLAALAPRVHMGLITNGLPEVQRPRLAGSGLESYFKFVAISEEIGIAKPDPRFFAAALVLAGSPDPRSVLVIGDSLNADIRGGFEAGLDTLWVKRFATPPDPRWPPTYQVDRLEQIPTLLANML